MDTTTIIGIDCATEDKKIGLAVGLADADRCAVQRAGVCSSKRKAADEVCSLLEQLTKALLALDAPLGWPRAMGSTLSKHHAGQPLHIEPNSLFRRETDRFIKRELGKQSLDVGADRIARTAHCALKLLEDVRLKVDLPIPLAWSAHYPERVAAIEVYPAATLIAGVAVLSHFVDVGAHRVLPRNSKSVDHRRPSCLVPLAAAAKQPRCQ